VVIVSAVNMANYNTKYPPVSSKFLLEDNDVFNVKDEEYVTIPLLKVPNIKVEPLYREASYSVGRRAWATDILTKFGKLYVNLSFLENDPFDIFVVLVNGSPDNAVTCEVISRLCSLFLQVNSEAKPPEKLVRLRDQLRGIGGSPVSGFTGVSSIPEGVGKALDVFIKQYHSFVSSKEIVTKQTIPVGPKNITESGRVVGDICPHCGQLMSDLSNCSTCGYTR
jgi:hypothetical protein